MLITTASQNFSPYSWVDTYRSTSTEDEYLMVGYYEIPNSTVSEDEHEVSKNISPKNEIILKVR